MLLACGTGLAVFAYLSTPAPVAAEAYGPETCSTCIEEGDLGSAGARGAKPQALIE